MTIIVRISFCCFLFFYVLLFRFCFMSCNGTSSLYLMDKTCTLLFIFGIIIFFHLSLFSACSRQGPTYRHTLPMPRYIIRMFSLLSHLFHYIIHVLSYLPYLLYSCMIH